MPKTSKEVYRVSQAIGAAIYFGLAVTLAVGILSASPSLGVWIILSLLNAYLVWAFSRSAAQAIYPTRYERTMERVERDVDDWFAGKE